MKDGGAVFPDMVGGWRIHVRAKGDQQSAMFNIKHKNKITFID